MMFRSSFQGRILRQAPTRASWSRDKIPLTKLVHASRYPPSCVAKEKNVMVRHGLHTTSHLLSAAPEGKSGATRKGPMARGQQRFPDWIEEWNPTTFRRVGYGLAVGAVAVGALGGALEGVIAACPVGLYWWIGLRDMSQKHQSLRRNFPVLANFRYMLESIRPEIRQYFIESDIESVPFSRLHRMMVYQRATNSSDTLPFGTRRDVYKEGYEWICHSMYPASRAKEEPRVKIGVGPNSLVKQPYDAALLNVSGMSYGALSDNAILALSGAAKLGDFYHNTGEGGISRFHLEGGGSLVWNVGTGYFGCRQTDGTFSVEKFRENSTRPTVKMVELKISQGAKPGHGGILPGSKVTPQIAEARGVKVGETCNSPALHSAFDGPRGMVDFVDLLRDLSGGKPVGVKMCIGRPAEVAALVRAMMEKGPGHGPDFFTIDGAEGGTGAAPPEFSNSVGTPLIEGLVLMDDLLKGVGLRERVKIIASGKVVSGFSVVRNIALGADLCNAARAMMFALGCIQALKCGSNRCPTGITSLKPELMNGLVVPDKTVRVHRYQEKTMHSAAEIVAAAGVSTPAELSRGMINLRTESCHHASYEDIFPSCEPRSLLNGRARPKLVKIWDEGSRLLDAKPGRLMVSA